MTFDLDGVFSDEYLHFDLPDLTPERNAAEVEEMVELLGLAPGMAVLDAPCGHGRHANLLAGRGLRVVGVDRTPAFLDMARRDALAAGVRVDYRELDLREMAFEAEFDAALSWYHSFGYFDDETDRDLLRRYRRALRPGGRLLIEMQSPYRLVPGLIAGRNQVTYVTRMGEDLLFDVVEHDAVTSRTHGERVSIRDGRVRRARYTLRVFSAAEIRSWLLDAGFDHVEVTDRGGEPFTVLSRRMVVRATVDGTVG